MIRDIPVNREGFSLIELLVSMFLLVVLVLLASRLFDTSTNVWKTGTRKAEVNLTGRSVLDYLDRDIARAVFSTNTSSSLYNLQPVVGNGGKSLTYAVFNDNTNGYTMIGGVIESVTVGLQGTTLFRGTNEIIRNIDDLQFNLDSGDPDWPTFVDVTIHFRAADDRGTSSTNFNNVYSKRIYFPNYTRCRYDDY